MDEFLDDPEIEKKIKKMSEDFAKGLLERPKDVGNLVDGWQSGVFDVFDIDKEGLFSLIDGADEDTKKKLGERLSSLKMMFLMSSLKEHDNEITRKVDELYAACLKKSPEELEKLLMKPRFDVLRKMLSSFKRSWRNIDEKGLPQDAIMDNRFKIIKSMSEGMYLPMLSVLQEMAQIVYGYRHVPGFGGILQQFENSKYDLDVFVNRSVYNIRNADSHENAEFEGVNVTIYDKDGKEIQKLTGDDLNETISWISLFFQSVYYSLQKNYFKQKGIGTDMQDRIENIVNFIMET